MEVQDAFRIVYGVLIAVNISGNTLVCLVVYRFPSMKTPMNYLLVHLAVCDMLAGVFLFLRLVLLGLYRHPTGLNGDFLCRFITYGNIGWLCTCAAIYTLVAIAWERFIAITKPHATRLSNRKLKAMMVGCWFGGMLICLPELIATGYNPQIKSCDWLWAGQWNVQLDALVWLTAALLLPLCILTVLYGNVMRILWFTKQRVGDVTQRSLMKSRKKITQAVITVTVMFFTCWTPNITYFVISSFQFNQETNIETMSGQSPVLYPVSHALILLNSSINPFIYALQDSRFKNSMARILCRCNKQISPEDDRTEAKEEPNVIQQNDL